MHDGELNINEKIVKQLINEQFPQYSGLPVCKVNSTGTVNAIYKLGEDYCIRLPRLDWAEESLKNEWITLPVISKNVSLAVPQIIEKGSPHTDYPFIWGIYRWIEGDIYDNLYADEEETAKALAQFIQELHSVKLSNDALKAGRKPLRELDEMTIDAIIKCKGDIDCDKTLKLWQKLQNTKPWNGDPVWIHADLLKPNLLLTGGKLSAIIDFGSAGVGDPAFDVVAAWTVLSSKTRMLFKNLLNTDDHVWNRAKAYALHQAALIIPYYRKSNPEFVKQAINTIKNVLE